ncbi:DUF6884 domain-containing protein [Haloarcula sp. K1]|uniref:DUF6884 domain-containing protein n=1 Tax=Haloarcula sp. K1 TaxID=1622207 RepID=UPI001E62A6FC|nr:DUF6884 domain-containing protein [Haloarcula sp. K1]
MTDHVIGITACSKSKRGGPDSVEPFPARDLYDSWLFDGRVAALEANCDRWCIMSAKHGYVEPNDEIAWYDQEMSDLPEEEQRKRAEDVARNVTEADRVMILMGRNYAEPLKSALPDSIEVKDPLEGVGLFDQRKELDDLAKSKRPTSQTTFDEVSKSEK